MFSIRQITEKYIHEVVGIVCLKCTHVYRLYMYRIHYCMCGLSSFGTHLFPLGITWLKHSICDVFPLMFLLYCHLRQQEASWLMSSEWFGRKSQSLEKLAHSTLLNVICHVSQVSACAKGWTLRSKRFLCLELSCKMHNNVCEPQDSPSAS